MKVSAGDAHTVHTVTNSPHKSACAQAYTEARAQGFFLPSTQLFQCMCDTPATHFWLISVYFSQFWTKHQTSVRLGALKTPTTHTQKQNWRTSKVTNEADDGAEWRAVL